MPKIQADDSPPPTYRELFETEKNIPISVPINATHENFVVRIEPVVTGQPQWSESKTSGWISPLTSSQPKCASFKLDNRQFAVSMMRIIIANKTKRASHSILPPFLRFKRPYNWVSPFARPRHLQLALMQSVASQLFYASMPVLMPVLMLLV